MLVIWKLDRLGRSLRHLVELVGILMDRGVGLQSLHDPVDTTTPHGRLTFNIFASLAEFERDLIRERTQAGLSAARARGRNGGRPKGITPQAEATAMAAETLYREGKLSTRQIADKLHISKSTLYAYLRHRGGRHRRLSPPERCRVSAHGPQIPSRRSAFGPETAAERIPAAQPGAAGR